MCIAYCHKCQGRLVAKTTSVWWEILSITLPTSVNRFKSPFTCFWACLSYWDYQPHINLKYENYIHSLHLLTRTVINANDNNNYLTSLNVNTILVQIDLHCSHIVMELIIVKKYLFFYNNITIIVFSVPCFPRDGWE